MKKIQLEAKSARQSDYIRSIVEHDITICTGPSGCGKTLIACYMAVTALRDKKVERIIISRPLVYTGSDIGALKGTLSEKILPHFQAIEECIKQFYTHEEYIKLLDRQVIQYRPCELMRGATFHNTFMILTEAQNATKEQIKMFITRMGIGSKVIVEGDADQTDLRNPVLLDCINKLSLIPEIGIVKLVFSDIQRNPLIIKVLQALV